MCLVPTTDDPIMVAWHVPMVSSNNVEPCHHADCTRRLACLTLYDGCGAGCAMSGTGWRVAGDRWRDVSFAGMAGGDGMALVLVSHDGVDRREVQDVLRRRWPDVVVKSWSRRSRRGDVAR